MTEKVLQCDVLVVGTGAAGLTAAVSARKGGLDVLIVEKEAVYGGTTATSGGVLWVPGNRHGQAVAAATGVEETPEKARSYLEAEAGNYGEPARIDAYLRYGPAMVDYMEAETEVKFYGMAYPDYHSEHPAASSVRSLGTVDYQASTMGPHLATLKNQLPQTLFLGLAVGSSVEMKAFMAAGRSFKAMLQVGKRMLSHFGDLIRYGRSEQMVRGRALIGRLARTAFDLGIPLWLSSPVRTLVPGEGGRVVGAIIDRADGPVRVEARRGVILATGGYANDDARRAATYPAPAGRMEHRSPANDGNTGDGIRMAESVGGAFNGHVGQPAAWMPVSYIPGRSGSEGVWPHLVDRQKPGFIMVTQKGRRFGDESAAYTDLVPALINACAAEGATEASAWMIADARGVRRWGIGYARPFPVPHGHHLRSGYLLRADTLAELATKTGIDAAGLEETVQRFNSHAAQGQDPDFGRGQRVYDLYQGDEEQKPNPCLAPLVEGPFYAVRIMASEIGTFAGLKTDACARVLNEAGQPVPGLYAVGNDQASVFGGAYPGAGATLGPAMTFGWIAGRHIAGLHPED